MAKAISIDLDKSRRLKFDFNAICEFEDKTGISLLGLFADASKDDQDDTAILRSIGFVKLRTLLWAGLRWEERGLTEERLGAIIQKVMEDGMSLLGLYGKVVEALMNSGVFGNNKTDEGNVTAEAAN